ncbi:MAG TPA: hypothetical protein K8W19_06840, partial [Victivallis vadensis]|nr:hypothetical protein [Victivallis vadensis]
LTSLCVYRQINSYQPPSGYLSIIWSASGGSARDLRRQQAQGVPKACKKAGFAPTGAVCRSCTTLPVSIRVPPPGGKTGTVFPALKYSAPAPCRSGSKGEAPWSPKAKSRNLFSDDSRMSQIVTNFHFFLSGHLTFSLFSVII